MTRIGSRLIQVVGDDTLVFSDDQAGLEATRPLSEAPALLEWFAVNADRGEAFGIEGIMFQPEEYNAVERAIDYFLQVASTVNALASISLNTSLPMEEALELIRARLSDPPPATDTDWIITFGIGYDGVENLHPVNRHITGSTIAVISGVESEVLARQLAFTLYGDKWAFLYRGTEWSASKRPRYTIINRLTLAGIQLDL